jgi:hypothetical protein
MRDCTGNTGGKISQHIKKTQNEHVSGHNLPELMHSTKEVICSKDDKIDRNDKNTSFHDDAEGFGEEMVVLYL